MKNILIITKLLILSLFIAQTPKNNTVFKTDKIVSDSIKYVIDENIKQIEEVKTLKLKNDEELSNLKKLEDEKKQLMKSNLKLVDLLIVKKNNIDKPKVVKKNKKIQYAEKKVYKIDSTCISYVRNGIFGKKKCEKWKYLKYTK